MPDFDEWYVVDRHPAAIQLAKEKWRELEQMKLEVNRIQGLVKNNRHSLSTSKYSKQIQKKCDEQCDLHIELTDMQRELSIMKIAFRSCGVIKITHMERAFLSTAERLLPRDTFKEIKKEALSEILRKIPKELRSEYRSVTDDK